MTDTTFKGENYDSKLSLKDIAARVRAYAKEKYPECTFSVTKDGYRSIYIHLMSSPFQAFKGENENGYLQLNQYYIKEDERLTEEAKKVMADMHEYLMTYNYDDSDSMTDYFCVNFYGQFAIGKWNQPFRIKIEKEKEEDLLQVEPIAEGKNLKLIEYSTKALVVVGDTKPVKDKLKELGGRFNFRLWCGSGWVFPKKREEELKSLLMS